MAGVLFDLKLCLGYNMDGLSFFLRSFFRIEGEGDMLVLSRHRDEAIMIGDEIVVTVVDIRGDKVRLGIDAPSDIPVHRQEVYDAIQRENRKADQKDTVSLNDPPVDG
jgi:carbon storage regulator